MDNNSFDLGQLQKVLAEIEEPNPLSDWGELTTLIVEIQDNITLKSKLKNILTWINANPRHTYPKKVTGWLNTIRSQFCGGDSDITAQQLVDHMIQLKILNIIQCVVRSWKSIITVDYVRLDRKRCHNDMVDEDHNQLSPIMKRSRFD